MDHERTSAVGGFIFVSHHPSDLDWAQWIAWELIGAGYEVVLPAWDFPPGTQRVLAVDRALSQAARILCVLSAPYMSDSDTQAEWSAAVLRARGVEQPLLLPVLVRGDVPTGPFAPLVWIGLKHLLEETARRVLVEGVGGSRRPAARPVFPGGTHSLLTLSVGADALLERFGATAVGAGSPGLQEATLQRLELQGPRFPGCPYPGLEHFREADTPVFFGREAELEECLKQMGPASERRYRWLRIEGSSGAGKSSFCHAGLIPAIRRGRMKGGPSSWHVAVMRPGRSPLYRLADAITESLRTAGNAVGGNPLLDDLNKNEWSLVLLLKAQLSLEQGFLLVVDQLEELFTRAVADGAQAHGGGGAPDGAEWLCFARLLGNALREHPRFYLITTLRSDFVDRLEHLPVLAEMRTHVARCELDPLRGAQLEAAIVKPAELAGLRLEAGLCAQILSDAVRTSGVLPLVSYVLNQLWRSCPGGELTIAAYDQLGGVGGALARGADDVMSRFTREQQACAERMLLFLVEVGRETGDTRVVRKLADVLSIGDDREPERAQPVLMRLSGGLDPGGSVDAPPPPRLVVVMGEGDKARVELAHEALLLHWDYLVGLIERRRPRLALLDSLDKTVSMWLRSGRPDDGLPRGRQLRELGQLEKIRELGLRSTTREYLRLARVRQRRRVLRWIGAAALVLVAAAGRYLDEWLELRQLSATFPAIGLARPTINLSGGKVRSWRQEPCAGRCLPGASRALRLELSVGEASWAMFNFEPPGRPFRGAGYSRINAPTLTLRLRSSVEGSYEVNVKDTDDHQVIFSCPAAETPTDVTLPEEALRKGQVRLNRLKLLSIGASGTARSPVNTDLVLQVLGVVAGSLPGAHPCLPAGCLEAWSLQAELKRLGAQASGLAVASGGAAIEPVSSTSLRDLSVRLDALANSLRGLENCPQPEPHDNAAARSAFGSSR